MKLKKKPTIIFITILSIITLVTVGLSTFLCVKLYSLEKKYNDLKESIENTNDDNIMNGIEAVQLSYTRLNERVETLENKKDSTSDISKLSKRIDELSKTVSNNSSKINTINSKVSNNDSNAKKVNTMYKIYEKEANFYSKANSGTEYLCNNLAGRHYSCMKQYYVTGYNSPCYCP